MSQWEQKNHLLQAQKMARHNMQYINDFTTNRFSFHIFYQSVFPSTQQLKHVILDNDQPDTHVLYFTIRLL